MALPTRLKYVEPLAYLCRINDMNAFCNYAHSLSGISATVAGDVPLLINALADEDRCVRLAAVAALKWGGKAVAAAVPALVAALHTPGALPFVCWTLSEIGPFAKAAIPGLIASLKDGDRATTHHIMNTFESIGVSDCLSGIIDCVQNTKHPGRYECYYMLQLLATEYSAARDLLSNAALVAELEARATDLRIKDQESSLVWRALGRTCGDDEDDEELTETDINTAVLKLTASKTLPEGTIVKLKQLVSGEDTGITLRFRAIRLLRVLSPNDADDVERLIDRTIHSIPTSIDVKAERLIALLKRFYLLGCLYREGIQSFRDAEHAINDQRYQLYKLFDKDDIAVTAVSFSNIKKSKLPELFCEIFEKDVVELFIEPPVKGVRKAYKPPTGVPGQFSEDGWAAWKWTDEFLRRQLPADWFGFSRLTPQKSDEGAL